jgi:hypothetical protein
MQSGNNGITNTSNVRTGSICCMDLIGADVGIMRGQLVEGPSDVIGGTRVSVLIVIAARRSNKSSVVLLDGGVIFISVPAFLGRMTNLPTESALGPG